MQPDYVTRFAPSPTGPLHLGHAYSALIGWDRAKAAGGTFLLRIEDLDSARCKPQFEADIYQELAWLGLDWPYPVVRQSERTDTYRTALNTLITQGFCYPCGCTRGDIRQALSAPQEGDVAHGPDGPVYPGTCRHRSMAGALPTDAIRLNVAKAVAALGDISTFGFIETAAPAPVLQRLDADHLLHRAGDVVLSRGGAGVAYHLAVVVDDAAQNITEVVRGSDLAEATHIHRLLQTLLQYPTPTYCHHALIRDDAGKRLAKRDDARALAKYRAEGATPQDIRRILGFPPEVLPHR